MNRERGWTTAQGALVAAFLLVVASYYRPGLGWSELIGFSQSWHDRELEVVRATPHYDASDGGYDGRFYAQLAFDPLVLDRATDAAMDTPVLRAHRILLSWLAALAGLGNPWWTIQVFALLNVGTWLILAGLLRRWIDASTPHGFALWAGCLLGYGILGSVRFSLTDAPVVLFVAMAVAAIETSRPRVAAVLLGASGLVRETGLLGNVVFLPKRSSAVMRSAVLVASTAAPLALWYVFLAINHDWRMIAGTGNVGIPFVGLWWKVTTLVEDIARSGVTIDEVAIACGLVGFLVQGLVTLTAGLRGDRSPWTLVAGVTFLFVLCAQLGPWGEVPGAYLRLALPLAIGANVILARDRAPWSLVAISNAGVVPGVLLLAFRAI